MRLLTKGEVIVVVVVVVVALVVSPLCIRVLVITQLCYLGKALIGPNVVVTQQSLTYHAQTEWASNHDTQGSDPRRRGYAYIRNVNF